MSLPLPVKPLGFNIVGSTLTTLSRHFLMVLLLTLDLTQEPTFLLDMVVHACLLKYSEDWGRGISSAWTT